MFVKIHDSYVSTFLSKLDCDCSPYTTVTTGDNGNFTLKPSEAWLIGIIYGSWVHLLFNPRLAVLVLWRNLFWHLYNGFHSNKFKLITHHRSELTSSRHLILWKKMYFTGIQNCACDSFVD